MARSQSLLTIRNQDRLWWQETRYRQRYLDGIVNPWVRDIFDTRSRIITFMRNFLLDRHFLEVRSLHGSAEEGIRNQMALPVADKR